MFLERAADLVPAGELDLGLETDLIDALVWDRKGEEALAAAPSSRSWHARPRPAIGSGSWADESTPGRATTPERVDNRCRCRAGRAHRRVAAGFEAAGDELALRIAYRAIGESAKTCAPRWTRLPQRTNKRCRIAGPRGSTALVGYQSHGHFHGSTPLTELLAWQDEQDPREQRGHWLRAHRCAALAMLGRPDEARALHAELRNELVERGGAKAVLAALEGYDIEIELLGGDPEAAVAAGEESCRMREELGRWAELSTTAAGLALAYIELDRLGDAERWTARAAELGAAEDATTQMLWRQARARVLARRGDYEQAERLASEAVEIGEATEDLNSKAEVRARPRRSPGARRSSGGRRCRERGGARPLRGQGERRAGAADARAAHRAPGRGRLGLACDSESLPHSSGSPCARALAARRSRRRRYRSRASSSRASCWRGRCPSCSSRRRAAARAARCSSSCTATAARPATRSAPAFVAALRRLGDRAPVVVLPQGEVGWWHDRAEGAWGSYVLREVIPAALRRSGADPDRVAIGGISMGGFGALNLGRHRVASAPSAATRRPSSSAATTTSRSASTTPPTSRATT